jgi:hypothetical protein
MDSETFIGPTRVNVDVKNRIALPKFMSDRLTWLEGTGSVMAWLLLISLGRYRLLSDEDVQGNVQLESVRSLILERKSGEILEPTQVHEPNRAALITRLILINITPPKPAWRFSKPEAMQLYAPVDCRPNDLTVFLSTEGYWEFWCTDLLRKAASDPIADGTRSVPAT